MATLDILFKVSLWDLQISLELGACNSLSRIRVGQHFYIPYMVLSKCCYF